MTIREVQIIMEKDMLHPIGITYDRIEVLTHFPVGHRGKIKIGFNPPIFPCMIYGIRLWGTLEKYCKERSRDKGTVTLWINEYTKNDRLIGEWYNGERVHYEYS